MSIQSILSRNATQTVGLRRRVFEVEGWGEAAYEPSASDPPEEILAVYEPGYSDSGRDGERRFRGRVFTTTLLNLGDLIIGDLTANTEEPQEVTDVAPIPASPSDGTIIGYEALL